MKNKPENVKIISISAVMDPGERKYILGLGDDGVVYQWNTSGVGSWDRWSNK